ncbi:MAG: phage terminase large subunit, partial [Beijerinckiaceae bacterium]
SWYSWVFPRTRIDSDKNTELEFKTTHGGYRLSTSVGGTLTGRGGNLFIIDDPLKANEADLEAARTGVNNWYDNTLYSRLDNKNDDAIIVIMQRLHVEDLVAHVLEQEPWIHLTIPAIAEAPQQLVYGNGQIYERRVGDVLHPSRESREAIESAKRALGTYAFAAQYQQEPVPLGGGMIKLDWFQRYEAAPTRTGSDQIVQSWDTASKAEQINDCSVCSTWLVRTNNYYLIDVYRDRLEYPALKRRAIESAQRHHPDAILIEDKGSGTQLIQDLRASGSLHPIGVQPEGDKIVRMSIQSAKIEARQVWLPHSAHWLQEFETEIMRFPKGRFDDQIDSLSQFLRWITDRTLIQIFV